jgi:hypothetical protein
MRDVRDVKVTLGVGIALLVAVGALTLTHSPPRTVQAGTKEKGLLAQTSADAEVCQANEALPADVSAIRLSVWAFFGARIGVRVLSGSQVLTEGRQGPAWTGSTVTVPVTPLSHAVSPVEVCFRIGPNSEPIFFLGGRTLSSEAAVSGTGQPLGGRMGIEYLAPGQGSWWSRILQVARHMGVGHALSGTWVVLLIFALVSAAGLLAIRLVLRELP